MGRLVVAKFGGTSVGDLNRIRKVARRVGRMKDEGNDVVVVVSAMAGETDRLIALAHQVAKNPVEREMDVLLTTGEQVSIALLSLCLNDMGYKAKSYTGFQVRILTDSFFGRAKILDIDRHRIEEDLKNGYIVVVAGFQGVDEKGNLTTLGRGGSDTTAVALAAALKADICEIYTDVPGVFTTDPNVCPKARKIDKISYEEMLEMASLGAKVLHTRSVEFAMKYNVPIHVRSTFLDEDGTYVVSEEEIMEKPVVSGVTYDRNTARIEIMGVPDRPGIAAKLFGYLADENIIVDMIVQTSRTYDGLANISFTIPKGDFNKAKEIVEKFIWEVGAEGREYDSNVAKVSIVGLGMRTHSGIASKMFSALANEGINIIMISTSEIKISCIIEEKYTELAVRVLHDAFGLDKS